MITMRTGILATGFAEFVATLPLRCRVVEIGCYRGEATRVFLTQASHVTCVDIWEDYTEDNGIGGVVEMRGMAAVEAAFDAMATLVPGRIDKIKGRSLDVARLFPDASVDVVYIDANHSYDHVVADIVAWLPKIKPGGLIAGHDFDRDRWGVVQGVRQILGNPDAVFSDSTWVRRVGPGPKAVGPPPVPVTATRDPGPKVLIGIPCPVQGGFRPFDINVQQLMLRRADTQVFYAMGGVLPGARNRIVREALNVNAEYIWFLDDDQPFFAGDPADPSRVNDLDALLAHGLDAVVPLSARRGAPFLPLIYDRIHEDGWIAAQRFLDPSDHGVIPIAAAGFAGLLIKTACLRAMGTDGWFEFTHPPDDFDNYSEDLPFYRRLQASGVQLYCDLEVRFGHAVTSVAYILRQQGQWVTVLADKDPFVAFPQPIHPLSVPRQAQPPRQQLVTVS